jgi:hypothetical protein
MSAPAPAPVLTLSDVQLTRIAVGSIEDSPRCRCGARLSLHQPDGHRPLRLIATCPRGCEWCLVEVALPAGGRAVPTSAAATLSMSQATG